MSAQQVRASAPMQMDPGPLRKRLQEEARRYQRALERDPRNPQALAAMSLIALASGQPGPAVLMARAAVGVAPAMGSAWVALGQALRADKRPGEAEKACDTAIRLDGMDPLARLGLGEIKLATDRPQEALVEFELAIRRDPSLVPAHLGMGHALVFLKRHIEALEAYAQVLLLNPRHPEGEFAIGFTLARMGRAADAERRYRRAIALRPDFAAAWMNLGCLLREQGQDFFARSALQHAIDLRPDDFAGWINLSLLERECGRDEQAEAHLRQAFALDPEQVETHVAWAQFCAQRGDTAGAHRWLQWVDARSATSDEAANLKGILLHNEGRFPEAVAAFERAEEMGSIAAASNRGNSLIELGCDQAALEAHRVAVTRDPHNPGARYNLALTELRLGEWREGWRNYDARWSFREVHQQPRRFDQPRWRGEPLRGQRILLHAEQGLGDTIQFCRYAALVAARGSFPILQVQAPVEKLVRSLAVVHAGQATVAQLGQTVETFDLECPLMTLPAVFGTTIQTVPWAGSYLWPNPQQDPQEDPPPIAAIEDLLAEPRRFRVGIAWAGNPDYKADRNRSVHLRTLLPLLRAFPEVRWIALQKGPAAARLAELPPGIRLTDGSSHDADLAQTAALVAALDLVITTDTCIAHLAGAMGKSVWILLPHLSDWRWLQRTNTTPWYPTAELIRQQTHGDWLGVIQAVELKLRMLLA